MQDLFALKAGAIIKAWMPEREAVFARGPKFRPVLVLDKHVRTDGDLEVLVAYGTSKRTNWCDATHFVVPKGLNKLLRHDTKFCLERRMWLPASEAFFTKHGEVQTLGSVPFKCLPKFQQAAQNAGLL